MPARADIMISTPGGRPLAVVDVKNIPRITLDQAVDLRDAILQHLPRPVKYVLIVSQTKGFIWRDQGAEPHYGEPEVLDMRPVLKGYLTDADLDRHFRGTELRLIFSHWLGDLARGTATRPAGTAEQGTFSDFTSDVRRARIDLEALV